MKKEKELLFQPIGKTKGGWVSSAAKRLETDKLLATRNLIFVITVAACVLLDAVIIATMI